MLLHVPPFGRSLDLCPTVLITPNVFKTRLIWFIVVLREGLKFSAFADVMTMAALSSQLFVRP